MSYLLFVFLFICFFFFFSSRRRHTRCSRDWSSDVCSSDLRERIQHGSYARVDPHCANGVSPVLRALQPALAVVDVDEIVPVEWRARGDALRRIRRNLCPVDGGILRRRAWEHREQLSLRRTD